MRLRFDQNLSSRLPARLADEFEGAQHVRDLELATADDRAVWQYAKEHGLTIVSKDADFRQLSFVLGFPPKVVWLRVGNGSTNDIEALIRSRATELRAFERDAEAALLVITP